MGCYVVVFVVVVVIKRRATAIPKRDGSRG